MGSSQSKSPSKEVSKDAENKKSTESVDDQDKMMEAAAGDSKTTPVKEEVIKPDLAVSEEEVASVEAAAKKMRDTVGGTSIEIVLSPAIKKVNYYLKCNMI